jgi:hypothetical protein
MTEAMREVKTRVAAIVMMGYKIRGWVEERRKKERGERWTFQGEKAGKLREKVSIAHKYSTAKFSPVRLLFGPSAVVW